MDILAPDKDLVDIILLIIQIATLIALIIYVKKTADMAVATEESSKTSELTLKEMKETRDQEIAPYIVCYFKLEDHSLFFVIENVGKGLAKDITFKFDPKLQCHYDISNTPLIKKGIPSIPPNYKIKTYVGTSFNYLKKGWPLSYNAKITYKGGLNQDIRSTEQIIDLEYIKGIHFPGRNRMHDLVNEIKEMREIQEKILNELENKK